MPRFLTIKEIENGKFMPTSTERASKLQVKESYKTERHTAYEVTDPEKLTKHTVIYKKEKKPPLDWACDCEWYTTKTINNGIYCAHILAVHLNATK